MKTKILTLPLLTAALFLLGTITATHAGKGNGKGGGGGGGEDPGGGSGGGTDRIVFSDTYSFTIRVKGTVHTPLKTHIFSMNPDGTGVEQLTIDTTADRIFEVYPRWSPDRNYILFNRNGTLHIMDAVGEAYGGESFPVVSDVAFYSSDWSPDGRFICFPWNGWGLACSRSIRRRAGSESPP